MNESFEFKLIHLEEKLMVSIKIDGKLYLKDVTEYFENGSPFDDWLDFKLGLI